MSESSYTNGDMAGLSGLATARLRGMPVPALGQKITVTVAASSNAVDLPLGCHVMVTATQACFIRLGLLGTGADAVVDVDMYILPSVPYIIKMGSNAANAPYRRISAVRSAVDGILYIMPMLAD